MCNFIAGVEIVDPVKKYLEKPDLAPWTPTVPDDPQFAPRKSMREHPHYKETPVYMYNRRTRLLECE